MFGRSKKRWKHCLEIFSDDSMLQHEVYCFGFLEWWPENYSASLSGSYTKLKNGGFNWTSLTLTNLIKVRIEDPAWFWTWKSTFAPFAFPHDQKSSNCLELKILVVVNWMVLTAEELENFWLRVNKTEMVENWKILFRTIWITSGYVSITRLIEEPWFWIGEISGVEDLAITGSSLQRITINLNNSLYVCFLAALSSLNVTGIQTTPSSAGRQYALPSTLVVAGSPTGLMDAKWLTNLWWSEMKEIRLLDLYIFDIGPYYLS